MINCHNYGIEVQCNNTQNYPVNSLTSLSKIKPKNKQKINALDRLMNRKTNVKPENNLELLKNEVDQLKNSTKLNDKEWDNVRLLKNEVDELKNSTKLNDKEWDDVRLLKNKLNELDYQIQLLKVQNDNESISKINKELEDIKLQLSTINIKINDDNDINTNLNRQLYEINEKINSLSSNLSIQQQQLYQLKNNEIIDKQQFEDIQLKNNENVNQLNGNISKQFEDIQLKNNKQFEDIQLKNNKQFEDIQLKNNENINQLNGNISKQFEDIQLKNNKQFEDIQLKNDGNISKQFEDIQLKNDGNISKQFEDIQLKSNENVNQLNGNISKQFEDIQLKNNKQFEDIQLKNNENISKQFEDIQLKNDENISKQFEDIQLKNDENNNNNITNEKFEDKMKWINEQYQSQNKLLNVLDEKINSFQNNNDIENKIIEFVNDFENEKKEISEILSEIHKYGKPNRFTIQLNHFISYVMLTNSLCIKSISLISNHPNLIMILNSINNNELLKIYHTTLTGIYDCNIQLIKGDVLSVHVSDIQKYINESKLISLEINESNIINQKNNTDNYILGNHARSISSMKKSDDNDDNEYLELQNLEILHNEIYQSYDLIKFELDIYIDQVNKDQTILTKSLKDNINIEGTLVGITGSVGVRNGYFSIKLKNGGFLEVTVSNNNSKTIFENNSNWFSIISHFPIFKSNAEYHIMVQLSPEGLNASVNDIECIKTKIPYSIQNNIGSIIISPDEKLKCKEIKISNDHDVIGLWKNNLSKDKKIIYDESNILSSFVQPLNDEMFTMNKIINNILIFRHNKDFEVQSFTIELEIELLNLEEDLLIFSKGNSLKLELKNKKLLFTFDQMSHEFEYSNELITFTIANDGNIFIQNKHILFIQHKGLLENEDDFIFGNKENKNPIYLKQFNFYSLPFREQNTEYINNPEFSILLECENIKKNN